jgi:tetratricopeptide (TPR) repeat protein
MTMDESGASRIQGDLVQGDQYVLSGDFRHAAITIYERGIEVRRIPLQIPPPATHFTGRGEELEQLKAALQPGQIVTLYGPGGIGKTALAAEALAALHEEGTLLRRFPGGVLFHTFYGRPAAADCAAHIARSYDLDPNPDPFAALAAALRGRVALLVLDGAEECDDLEALLERRDRCGVLITSRRREDVRDIGIEVERLPPDDALALLRALAMPSPEPSPWEGSERADARAICELVGNLPLALRLAGAFMFREGQAAAEYAAWLGESGLEALDFGARRRESVPVLLAKSVTQVSAAAQAALAVAGCLALAPFDVTPVAMALELGEQEAKRALGELVNYELLRRTGERYETTHALVYDYARDRLAAETVVLQRLGEYYTSMAGVESAKGLPGYQRLNPERGHVLTVLAGLAAADLWMEAEQLVKAVDHWLDLQGYSRDRIVTLEVGLAAAQALGRETDHLRYLSYLGDAYHALGQLERANEQYEVVLARVQELGYERREGIDLGQVKRFIELYETLAVDEEVGDVEVKRVTNLLEVGLTMVREIGDQHLEGTGLLDLGSIYFGLGQWERGIKYYEAALAIARKIGDRRMEGNILGMMGLAYDSLGNTERAIEHLELALTIAKEIGDRRMEGNTLGYLGTTFVKLGKMERGIEPLEEALIIAQKIEDRRIEENILSILGLANFRLGQAERANEFHEAALALARERDNRSGEGNHLFNRGLALERLGRREEAIDSIVAALAIFEAIKAPTAEKARTQLARLRGAAS